MIDLHGYGASLAFGTWVTVKLALGSVILAVLLGLVTALAKLSANPALRGAATVYTTIIRGIPDLVLMLLIYFGLQIAVNKLAPMAGYDSYIDIDPFTAGTATIGFIFGAYMGETFRGAILAVPQGQLDAGRAFGMGRWRLITRILIPQMARYALPGFGNNWQVLLKATALVSIIGLDDLVRRSSLAANATRDAFTFYLTAAAVYLALTTVTTIALQWLERRANIGMAERHG